MTLFFNVQSVEEVHRRAEQIRPLAAETVPIGDAADRTLAVALTARSDLPGFARATMDGYAVRARDTFGASETAPAYLRLSGTVEMGEAPRFSVATGECARIGTGGMLPDGADAVVMVEHTRAVDDATVEISRPVAPRGNTIGPTEDAARGQVLLPAGQRLRPQDIGLFAALGVDPIEVIRRPRVGILSTGDEVLPIEANPGPGQVRDVNTYTLAAQVREAGAEPVPFGIVADDEGALRTATAEALARCDLSLLSGGSSVGIRDLTARVFLSFPDARLLVHGVAVAPGKPFIWVDTPSGHLLGLPGQVTSCMITFHLFVEPIVERMLGRTARAFSRFIHQSARLTRNLPSVHGREEYARVHLVPGPGGSWLAEPLFGASGLLRTLRQADGLVRIPMNTEGLEAGAEVDVMLFPGGPPGEAEEKPT